MTPDEIKILLDDLGVIQRNRHFRYTNGDHGSDYVDKYAIYRHVEETSRLCRSIAGHFDDDNVDVVVGPEKGGIVLSQWTAHHLIRMTHREVLSIVAQKRPARLDPDDLFYFAEEDVPYIERKNVLVVDDVLNTGGTVRKVVALARRHGGRVIGVGALCNRGYVTAADVGDDVPEFHALIDIPMERWNASKCPLCVSGIPISKTPGR